MINIKEVNITKANLISSIIVVFLLSIALTSTFSVFTYRHLISHLDEEKQEYISLQKERLKTFVDHTMSRFELRIFYNKKKGLVYKESELRNNIINIWNDKKKSMKESEYIFIIKLHNIKGGDEYGTMLVNPNLPELVGEKLSDSYKGAHGKEFVKEMLSKLNSDGEAFVHYWLRKPGSEQSSPKITYWKLFPKWQWIVGKGIYIDDIDDIMSHKKEAVFAQIKKDLFFIMIICLCFMVGAICLAYLFYRSINAMVFDYKIKDMLQKKQLHRFDLILNQAHDGIAISDLNGKIIYVNKSMAKMHGYEPGEVAGCQINNFHTPEQVSNELNPIIRKVIEHGFARGELNRMHKDGYTFPTTTSTTLLFNEKKEPEAVLGIVIDISNIVKAQKKAEAANIAKSTFLANMSHEIRTPMNGIIGMTRLALETSLNHKQKKLLNSVQISADGLLRLLNDILDFSKIEAGQLVLENKDFSFPAMLDNIISMLTFAAEKKRLSLDIITSQNTLPAFVRGDELRLRQILVNLIGNAIKFTKKGSVTIQVSCEERSKSSIELYFIVSDTGIGIVLDKQKDIFNHFSQADTSTAREFGGSGLGLAISKQLVKMMGGSIWIESQEGQGAAFHFKIVMKYGEKKDFLENSDKIKLGIKDLNILLVEDNEINRELALLVLAKGESNVICAENGKDALTILSRKKIDIVLMDIQMPVMDGLTATKIIREFEKGREQHNELPNDISKDLSSRLKDHHLPIVAMTANAMSGDREQCIATGMDGYLTKPFVPEDIFLVISRFCLKSGDGNE